MVISGYTISRDGFDHIPIFASKAAVMFENAYPKREVFQLQKVMLAIAKTVDHSVIGFSGINIVFLESPNIEIIFNEDFEGAYVPTIFFPVYKWMEKNYDINSVRLIMAEELVHAVCQLPDGEELESIVDAILKVLNPDTTYRKSFYNLLSMGEEPNPSIDETQ